MSESRYLTKLQPQQSFLFARVKPQQQRSGSLQNSFFMVIFWIGILTRHETAFRSRNRYRFKKFKPTFHFGCRAKLFSKYKLLFICTKWCIACLRMFFRYKTSGKREHNVIFKTVYFFAQSEHKIIQNKSSDTNTLNTEQIFLDQNKVFGT